MLAPLLNQLYQLTFLQLLKTLLDLIDGNFLIHELLIQVMTNEFFYPQHNQLLIALINYRQ
jgi:penicillin V acylase-like amidase (Ntn superfamily)